MNTHNHLATQEQLNVLDQVASLAVRNAMPSGKGTREVEFEIGATKRQPYDGESLEVSQNGDFSRITYMIGNPLYEGAIGISARFNAKASMAEDMFALTNSELTSEAANTLITKVVEFSDLYPRTDYPTK